MLLDPAYVKSLIHFDYNGISYDNIIDETGKVWSQLSFPPSPSVVFTGGTPSASSEYSGSYSADKAFDGNLTNYWNSAGAGFPEWLQYDFGLGNGATISKLAIKMAADGVKDITIKGTFDDPSGSPTWVTLYSGTMADINTVFQSFILANVANYRCYRITVTSNYRGDNYVVISEVRADNSHIIDPTQSVFGGASGYFDGGRAINTPVHSDFDLGSDDWTLNLRDRPEVLSECVLFAQNPAACESGVEVDLLANGDIVLFSSSNGDTWNIANGIVIGNASVDTDYDVMVCRAGNTIYYLFNGNLVGTIDVTGISLPVCSLAPCIGGCNPPVGGNYYFHTGHIDEFLWLKGQALRTSSYTSPGEAYALSVETVTVSIPAAQLTLQSYPPLSSFIRVPIPVSSLILTAFSPTAGGMALALIPAGHLVLTALNPEIINARVVDIPAKVMMLQKHDPSYSWTSPGFYYRRRGNIDIAVPINTLQTIYLCILTGAADSLADLIIPISSFQAVLRQGDPSFAPRFSLSHWHLVWWPTPLLLSELSCVIPNSIDYIEDIAARTHGDIVIQKGYKYSDGRINMEEICRVTYESLQIARGVKNDVATITGHRTIAVPPANNRGLSGIANYGVQTDGRRTFQAEPDLFLRVGSIFAYGDETVTVGQIEYIVDSLLQIMKVTEADSTASIVYPTPDPTWAQYWAYWGAGDPANHYVP